MSSGCHLGSFPRQRVAHRGVAWSVASIAVWLSSGCASDANGGGRGGPAGGAGNAAASASASGAGSGGASGNLAAIPGGTSGSGSATAASGGGGGAGSSRETCDPPGTTRSCCNGGTERCEGALEFAFWGPCLDASGAVVDCTDPCATDEFGRLCDAGAPPPPPPPPPDAGTPVDPPDTECGPGMECKPGAIRYCDDPAGEWTLSTCSATGSWGACVVTTVPAGAVGLGDCSANDYSPEMCCPQLFLCCQNDPFGAFEDWGSGACAAVSCP